MKRKINLNLSIISFLSILLTAIFITVVFHGFFVNQVELDLENSGRLVAEAYKNLQSPDELSKYVVGDFRVTLVDSNGEVLFESHAEKQQLDNHSNRPEIKKALSGGSGKAKRYSNTIDADTYYYAISLGDGNILRIAKQVSSVLGVFYSLVPVVLGIMAGVFIICIVLAGRVIKSIIKPIEKMSKNTNNVAYDELIPFAKTIEDQRIEIQTQLEKLSEEQEKIIAIIKNMTEGFVLLDNSGNILMLNDSAIFLLDSSNKDLTGRNVIYLSRNETLQKCISSGLKGKNKSSELSLKGRHLQILVNTVKTGDEQNGVICLILDVTEKKEMENMRRDFTANVSHELKTPLTSISGYAEMIKQGLAKAEDIKSFSDIIYNESLRMLKLIEDIIELSELEEYTRVIKKESVDLYKIAQKCIDKLKMTADKHDTKIELSGEECIVSGNAPLLEELIINLCDNAIRYSDKDGSVQVSVTKHDNKTASLSVKDNGIGIPQENRSRIFERFYRVDRSRSKQTGGTGLGLSIVKHIAEQHDAKIEVESDLGLGTQIRVYFAVGR